MTSGSPLIPDSSGYVPGLIRGQIMKRAELTEEMFRYSTYCPAGIRPPLTAQQISAIHANLFALSRTWSDLWDLLVLTRTRASALIRLRYDDIIDGDIIFRAQGRYAEHRLSISPEVRCILSRRREHYPADIWVFQSHSNRVKGTARPVTLIAFNQALKKAAANVTTHRVSSKQVSAAALTPVLLYRQEHEGVPPDMF